MPSQLPPNTLFLNNILKLLLIGSDSGKNIASVLECVGRHFDVSRVYLMECEEQAFFTSHEWCLEGVPSGNDNQRIPLTQIYVYYHHFDKDHLFAVSDSNTLPDVLRDFYQKKGVRSLLQVALTVQNRIVALLGVDDCEKNRDWTAEEKGTLSLLSQILALHVLHQKPHHANLNKGLAFDILNVLDSALYVIDVETHNLLYVNDTIAKKVPEIELGKTCYSFFEPGSSGPCPFCPVETYHRNPFITETAFDVRNPRLDAWSTISGTIIEWLDDKKICVIRISDTTEERDHEIKLEQLAYTDELTDIPNNRSYRQFGPLLLTSSAERNLNVAVIAIKVESLHRINSTTGYEQGDSILRQFTEKVSLAIPGDSVFARIRGNDFAILYPYNKSYDNVHIQAQLQRISLAVSEVQVPASVRGQLSMSVGVSIFPTDGVLFEDLNRKAGLALALNKINATMASAFYDAKVAAQQLAEDTLAQELAVALRNGELEVYYQPKYDVMTCLISGTEALLRWHHPVHGLMTGGAFIPLAETHGLISDIDDWVINETCRNIRQLCNAGCTPVPVAINLSPDKFYQDDVLHKLTLAMKHYNIKPELLEVEITERIALEDIDKATSIMRHIRTLGITLSIDDFGTGYSSLNYLRILPIDAVKLDRSFLTDIEASPTARNIVDFIVKLAGLLHFCVIMEGIETREQFEFARQIKCDVVQGYYTGRPVPLDALKQLLLEPKALPNLRCNTPHAQSFLRNVTPASLALWGLTLGGAMLGVLAVSGRLEHMLLLDDLPPNTLAELHHALVITGFSVFAFATLSAFLLWKCRSLSLASKQSMRDMIRMCKDACRGNLADAVDLSNWTAPTPLLTELGNELAMTTRKIHTDNVELLEYKNQCETLSLELMRWQAVQRITAESVSDILWEIDLPANRARLSPRFMVLFGHPKREFQYPDEFLSLVHPDDIELYKSRLSVLVAGEVAGRELEFRLRKADGVYIWIRSSGAVMYDENGNILRFVGALSEIARKAKDPFQDENSNDPLTGLLNRIKGEKKARHWLAENQNGMTLFLVDIENFKSINLKYGRLCGDSVLRRLARRLETFCLPGDLLFRYGGDEFALLKADCSDPLALEQCAIGMENSFSKPCIHHKVNISLHCNIAAISVQPSVVVDSSHLFQQAKQAVKKAHETGEVITMPYTSNDANNAVAS
ncbi:MAG: EAL domain-containing protein [Bilophila sp.]